MAAITHSTSLPPRFRVLVAAFALAASLWPTPPAPANPADPAPPDAPSAPPATAEPASEPLPGYFKGGGENRGLAVAEKRDIQLDIADVRNAQDVELAFQARDGGEAWFSASTNRFCRWLDTFHDNTFLLLDNLVRTLDLSWSSPASDYHAELSSFSLTPMVRFGGRGNDDDFKAKLKLRVDTAFPGIENRFHLVVDNLGRDYLPGSDPMKREDDWRVGVRSGWDDPRSDARFGVGGGLRFHSMHVVGYVDADLKWDIPLADGRFRVAPRVFVYTDKGWGHETRLSWQRWFGRLDRWGIELSAAENHSEHIDHYGFEQTLKIARAQSDRKNRGWLFQASSFPHLHEDGDNFYLDDAIVNLSWKTPVYRRWCYATVTPQLDFAKEDDREPRFSIRFAFEILFGGEARRLL